MAIGRREEDSGQEDSGHISDESDFYGDDATKQELMDRGTNFNIAEWWEKKTPSLTEMADKKITTATPSKAAPLYNIYEGLPCGRQLHETVDEFLERLPPATTEVSHNVPWIYIANPFISRKRRGAEGMNHGPRDITAEGPPDDEQDLGQFKKLGESLLEEFSMVQSMIERDNAGQAPSSIRAAIDVEKNATVKKIQDMAVEMHCITGKWMLFCHPAEVNMVWAVVARATASNELGIGAKVAPRNESDTRVERVMCIYTKDFTDMDDVRRVLRKVRDLGLIETRSKPIYYKCDAYTHLQLNSGNEYNIQASLYNSRELLQLKDKKLDGYFKRKFGDITE